MGVELLSTLWPSFPHYERFVQDSRLSGIRLNSAMMSNPELDNELKVIEKQKGIQKVPLYFDVKARQPRVIEVIPNDDHLDLRLNHAIVVRTPSVVIFKGGVDSAVLDHLEEGGQRLVFRGGPHYKVKAGESLYLRDHSLRILGDLFTPEEKLKIEKCRNAGFKQWFLSYVEEENDVDQFLELAGKDSEVWLKIESMRGLSYVESTFKKRDNLVLVAARGDLYVEIDKPHHIAQALRLIIGKDPQACVASRILLSVVESPVPSCADFLELQWLYDVGYRRMMLCDELCLRGELLGTAVSAFGAFRETLPDPTPC
jgi:pyruvate kinase